MTDRLSWLAGTIVLALFVVGTMTVSTGFFTIDEFIVYTGADALARSGSLVVENGTGTRAKIPGWQIAGKSGTTQSARDAWFIGFTGEYVVGVWMGYDDNSPLTGVTGGGLPAEIWRETMTRILANRQPVPLPMQAPDGNLGRSDPNFGSGNAPAQAPTAPAPAAPSNDQTILDVIGNILSGN